MLRTVRLHYLRALFKCQNILQSIQIQHADSPGRSSRKAGEQQSRQQHSQKNSEEIDNTNSKGKVLLKENIVPPLFYNSANLLSTPRQNTYRILVETSQNTGIDVPFPCYINLLIRTCCLISLSPPIPAPVWHIHGHFK